MKCNKCEAELEEGVTLCPQCGCDNASTEEAAVATAKQMPTVEKETTPVVEGKMTPGKIALLVVLAVVAIAVVIALVAGGMGSAGSAETTDPSVEQTESTEASDAIESDEATEETEATIPADGNPDDETCKGSYTASDEDVLAAADTVVATLGDVELTNEELQIYYWEQFYSFLNSYRAYVSQFNLDYTKPLDLQASLKEGYTWQQYFLGSAINAWRNYKSLTLAAEKAGVKLSENHVEEINGIIEDMETTAAASGYESAEAMLKAEMGAAATLDSYLDYVEDYYIGYLYYTDQINSIELTEEDVSAYFDEHADTYTASGFDKESEEAYVDVRHILVMPEGGVMDENGDTTYSDEEWEACRAAAQKIYDEWLAGEATEESFAALAMTHSDDGNYAEGGLYENVQKGQMVEPYDTWCFDESRQYGDHGLVQTQFGYHVMYFVDSTPAWYVAAESDMRGEKEQKIVEDAKNAYELNVDYSSIVLGFVDFSAG